MKKMALSVMKKMDLSAMKKMELSVISVCYEEDGTLSYFFCRSS